MGERRKFDKAFNEQAVLRVLSGETTVSKMAQELDVHYSTVRDWVRYYKKPRPTLRKIRNNKVQIYLRTPLRISDCKDM